MLISLVIPKPIQARTCKGVGQLRREQLLVGGVGLNFPELTWLISSSIVTDHYLFQRFKALFFGYLQEVRTGG